MTKILAFRNGELVKVLENYSDVDQNKYDEFVDCSSAQDALAAMLKLQEIFQGRLGVGQNMDAKARTQYIKNHVLYAEAELHEMLRELCFFKEWKTYEWTHEEAEAHREAAKEEFIDVLHFIWNIALALRLTADDIIQIYADKNIVNHLRQDSGY